MRGCPPKAGKAKFTRLWRAAEFLKTMVVVYVIQSVKYSFRYVGITNDLGNRLLRHNEGGNKSTKPYAPFKLIYTEPYLSYEEARKREKFLKSGVGRKFLDNLQS